MAIVNLEDAKQYQERLSKRVAEEGVSPRAEGSDPAITATSFSGADIKAVVFLPVDRQLLADEKKKLESDHTRTKTNLRIAEGIVQTQSTALSEAYGTYTTLYDYYLLLVSQGAPQGEIDDAEAAYLAAWGVVKMEERSMRWINDDYPPGAMERMRREVEGATAVLKHLQSQLALGEKKYLRATTLGDLQTITYSIHREKFPVRTLGRVYPKSYTRGPRTIAGSMIFTIINKHALWDLLQAGLRMYNTGAGFRGSDATHMDIEGSTILVDQLPPFDITLLFSNELGDNSYMVLYGVEIVNEGQTMSIQDILTENVMQFVARDMDPLRPIWEGRPKFDKAAPPNIFTVNNLLSRVRRAERTNPFI